jgi:hypothetical protein
MLPFLSSLEKKRPHVEPNFVMTLTIFSNKKLWSFLGYFWTSNKVNSVSFFLFFFFFFFFFFFNLNVFWSSVVEIALFFGFFVPLQDPHDIHNQFTLLFFFFS